MPDQLLEELKPLSETISQKMIPQESLLDLKKAFNLFSQETHRLESAYSALQKRLALVNFKLQESHEELQLKINELDATTNYLNSIISHISQGLLFIGFDGVISTYNKVAEEILNIPKAAVLYHSFWDRFEDHLLGFSMRSALSERQAPKTFPLEYKAINALPKHLEISTSFVCKGPLWNQGLIVLIRDVTEIHRLQLLTQRNDRMQELGEMAAAVAHEIRNPLGGIEGFASLLVRDLADSPHLQSMASHIVQGARTLNNLVSQVLHYSRPLHTHLERNNVVEVVNEVVKLLQVDETTPSSISFTVNAPSAVEAVIDKEMIARALLNLAFNSIHAMKKGGEIVFNIKTEKENNKLILMVSDTGSGIPSEYLKRIFSPFFTTKTHGNGLGLAEVHKIIEAHQGTIEVESTIEVGTQFTIALPLT